MPRKKKIDNDALIQMVKEELSQNEIMKKMGFKTSTQLKVAYANALMEAGQAPVLKTGRSGGAKAVNTTVSVGKRGSLIIPKNLVDHLGLNAGDKFDVRKSMGGGVSLRPNL